MTAQTHHAGVSRSSGMTFYAACECGWRTRTHFDELQAQRDAFLHNERASKADRVSVVPPALVPVGHEDYPEEIG